MAKRVAKAAADTADAGLQPSPAIPKAPPPVSLDAVIGQARAITLLRQAITSQRVHHAWIFSGPVGVGKHTAALAFAAELLSAGDPTGEALPLLRAGQHPDLHLIAKELAALSSDPEIRKRKQTNIPLDVLREFLLAPAARSRTVQSGTPIGKVFVIDEAELLDLKGQNSLLKVIEEPPEGTVIILITSDEHRLLTTIRSRCQRVGFATLTDTAMLQWLAARAIELPEDQRVWLTSYAAGAPGMLARALEHDLFAWHQALAPMLDAIETSPARANGLAAAMSKCIEDRAAALVKANPDASKDSANRLWGKRMVTFVAERIRRQLLAASRAKDLPRADRLAANLGACFNAERYLENNVLFSAVMDNMAVQLMTPK